jgi:hypothetical protein
MQTFVKVLQRRTKRQADEVVAWRIEQVPAMGRVDIEENTRNHNGLFLKELLEESLQRLEYTASRESRETHQTVVQWRRKLLQVKPDIEGGLRWDIHVEVDIM